MKTVLGRTPPAGYSRYQPYTLEEIDTHPDAMRLWATLVSIVDVITDEIQGDWDVELSRAYHNGYDDARHYIE